MNMTFFVVALSIMAPPFDCFCLDVIVFWICFSLWIFRKLACEFLVHKSFLSTRVDIQQMWHWRWGTTNLQCTHCVAQQQRLGNLLSWTLLARTVQFLFQFACVRLQFLLILFPSPTWTPSRCSSFWSNPVELSLNQFGSQRKFDVMHNLSQRENEVCVSKMFCSRAFLKKEMFHCNFSLLAQFWTFWLLHS